MKNKIFLIIMLLLMPTMAEAKIILCEKECKELTKTHIDPIKGLIYELSQKQAPATKKHFSMHAAKTIVWMDKLHKDKKTHNLDEYKKDDRAKLIITCIKYIVSVVCGYEDLPI